MAAAYGSSGDCILHKDCSCITNLSCFCRAWVPFMQKIELLRVLLVLLVVVSKVQSRVRNPQPVAANVFFQASSREQLVANRPEGAKIFPQRKNWNFQGPSFSCNRKSHAWSSCQASQLRRSSPRVAQDLRLDVVGAVHLQLGLQGLQLSSKRYFESPRSLCRTSLIW